MDNGTPEEAAWTAFGKYFYYINLYGLLSTILSFGITVALTRLINKLGKFY